MKGYDTNLFFVFNTIQRKSKYFTKTTMANCGKMREKCGIRVVLYEHQMAFNRYLLSDPQTTKIIAQNQQLFSSFSHLLSPFVLDISLQMVLLSLSVLRFQCLCCDNFNVINFFFSHNYRSFLSLFIFQSPISRHSPLFLLVHPLPFPKLHRFKTIQFMNSLEK